jgi:hypothetical protein
VCGVKGFCKERAQRVLRIAGFAERDVEQVGALQCVEQTVVDRNRDSKPAFAIRMPLCRPSAASALASRLVFVSSCRHVTLRSCSMSVVSSGFNSAFRITRSPTRGWVMVLSPSSIRADNPGFMLYLDVYSENQIARVG